MEALPYTRVCKHLPFRLWPPPPHTASTFGCVAASLSMATMGLPSRALTRARSWTLCSARQSRGADSGRATTASPSAMVQTTWSQGRCSRGRRLLWGGMWGGACGLGRRDCWPPLGRPESWCRQPGLRVGGWARWSMPFGRAASRGSPSAKVANNASQSLCHGRRETSLGAVLDSWREVLLTFSDVDDVLIIHSVPSFALGSSPLSRAVYHVQYIPHAIYLMCHHSLWGRPHSWCTITASRAVYHVQYIYILYMYIYLLQYASCVPLIHRLQALMKRASTFHSIAAPSAYPPTLSRHVASASTTAGSTT